MNDHVLQSQHISGKHIAKYVLLPGIWPRLKSFFGSGFQLIALTILSIFVAVRIIPVTHPYLRPQNQGRFSVRQVLAEGGRHITWDRHHLDQILVYIMIMTGFIALFVQFAILAFMLFTVPAFAGTHTNSWDWYFLLQPPGSQEQDYGLRFLDLVFGAVAPGGAGNGSFFGSCVGNTTVPTCLDYRGDTVPMYFSTFPSPLHHGLHTMLEFYNWMVIVVGFLILMYYIVTLLAETSVHGTFWGNRANKTWVPVRLIVFFLLIIPVPGFATGLTGTPVLGFNTAQLLTLNAAYFGNNLASNMWSRFNNITTEEFIGDVENLIATPSAVPNINGLVQFMSVAKACQYGEAQQNYRNIEAYIVRTSANGDNCLPLSTTTYAAAAAFASGRDVGSLEEGYSGDIFIRFGQRATVSQPTTVPGTGVTIPAGSPIPCGNIAPAVIRAMAPEYRSEMGYVAPHCGEITIPSTSQELSTIDSTAAFNMEIQERNYMIIQTIWDEPYIDDYAQNMVQRNIPTGTPAPPLPDVETMLNIIDGYHALIEDAIVNSVTNAIDAGFFNVPESLTQCGWVCAGIWYNRVAEINGVVTSSIFNMPQIHRWPRVLEMASRQRSYNDNVTPIEDRFRIILEHGQTVEFDDERDMPLAIMLNDAYRYWFDGYSGLSFSDADGNTDSFLPTEGGTRGQPIRDMLIDLFGLGGLYDMRENSGLHPLAQLSVLGKGLIDATVRYFGGAFAFTVAGRLGGATEALSDQIAGVLQGPVASFMISFGMIALTIGFVLFYVLPFLPFLYFMFAVAGWVKAIFEAMVGLPLWALAHLRIDGEGLIPQTAASGYFLILEILIRPMLIVFGLVASISIFAALVNILNELYDFVGANIGGFNVSDAVEDAQGATPADNPEPFSLEQYRGPIDQFFFTVTYAIIVYMLALSVFKLIDSIPNNILRWAGESVKSFGEIQGDPAEEFLGKIQGGITLIGLKASGALGGISTRRPAAIDSDPEAPDPYLTP